MNKKFVYYSYKNQDGLLLFIPLSLMCLLCKDGIIGFIFCWIIYAGYCCFNNYELSQDPYIQEIRKIDAQNQQRKGK